MAAVPASTDVLRPVSRRVPTYQANANTEPSSDRIVSVQRTDVRNTPEVALPRHFEFDQASPMLKPRRQGSVDAVVSMISDTTVFIDCLVDGQEIPIKLPLVVVPPALRRYGQAVVLSLTTDGGYRAMNVEAREPTDYEPLEGIDAVDEWLTRM